MNYQYSLSILLASCDGTVSLMSRRSLPILGARLESTTTAELTGRRPMSIRPDSYFVAPSGACCRVSTSSLYQRKSDLVAIVYPRPLKLEHQNMPSKF